MERLKTMKDQLINCVQSELSDMSRANTHELGEAVDMIKDLEETIYYATIVKAMEDREDKKEETRTMYYPVIYDPMKRARYDHWADTEGERMYYPRGRMMYHEDYPAEMRDYREGRSGMYRRTYMESKEMHEGKEKQMHELEEYMKELTGDVMDMIKDATPEEKMMLVQKLSTLADKIQ